MLFLKLKIITNSEIDQTGAKLLCIAHIALRVLSTKMAVDATEQTRHAFFRNLKVLKQGKYKSFVKALV